MKVKQKDLVSLLTELGTKSADGWPAERLQKRIKALPKLVKEEELKATTADGKALLKKLLAAVANEEDVEVVSGAKAVVSPTPAKEEKAPAKAAKKAPTKEEEEEEDEETEEESDEEEEESDEEEEESEEESDEDEEEAPKAKKEKKEKVKKEKKPRGPTITSRIREIMEKTSPKKPITIEAIVDILFKEFPDHDTDALHKTATGQVAYFLRAKNKNQKNPLNILNRRGEGYFVAPEDYEEPALEKKKAPKEEKKSVKAGAKAAKKAAEEVEEEEEED